jgi:LCP family protein required for cell wall assembly
MTHSAGTYATIDGALMVDASASGRGPRRRAGGSRVDPEAGLAELRAARATLAAGNADGEQPAPRRRLRRRRPRKARRLWVRVMRFAGLLLAGWIGFAIVLFVISSFVATGVPSAAVAALDGGGLPPFSATTILVLGSDGRPPGSQEPGAASDAEGGPTRSDTMMLIRTGGGSTSRLSIPRDTLVELPGHGYQKINAAFFYGGAALAEKTVESFLGIKVNHVIVINFTNFPALVNAMGGVSWHGGCVNSQISGGRAEGGYSLRLRAGTHHLNGEQALVLARTRENLCDAAWTDITRERNQQRLFSAMKSQVLSLTGFIHLPWIAWNAPQTLETDMGAPTLAGVAASLTLFGSGRTEVLPTQGEELSTLGDVQTISEAAKRAAVAKFLAG